MANDCLEHNLYFSFHHLLTKNQRLNLWHRMSTLCITVTSYIPPSGDCVLLWRLLHETRRLTVVVPLIIINYIDIWAAPGHVGETHQVCLHQISLGYWARNFYWLFHKYNLWIWDYELWNWVSLKTMQILKNEDKIRNWLILGRDR